MNTNHNGLKSMGQRAGRARIAQETLAILEAGEYVNGYDRRVSIAADLQEAIRNSVLYRPEELPKVSEQVHAMQAANSTTSAGLSHIEVTGETTLAAAARLIVGEGRQDAACLNFASAKNPGGGFLGGSQAQEESLARATGLYPCIAQMQEMYEFNRKLRTCLYSDHMIYSPGVPVIRDDEDRLLDQYYASAFITAPAVNAGVVKERGEADDERIEAVMKQRIAYILDVAAGHGHRTMVLGAYGCGVFRNDPSKVAAYFHDVLIGQGYGKLFDRIVFAVYDRSRGQQTLKAFQERLAKA